jgi:hypothetical protein
MRDKLLSAFPSLADKELSDEYIANHPDLMWDVPEIPLHRAVPLYMLWCIEHKNDQGSLVFDQTISALNKYARAKSPSAKYRNFKYLCSEEQISTVQVFLDWCKSELLLDYDPTLSRAIKNWAAVSRDYSHPTD